MLYILKIVDYLKILTEDEVKDLVAMNFSEYFESTKILYSELREKQNLREFAEQLYIFPTAPDEVEKYSSDNCVHHYNIEILNLFDPELQLINTKHMIKNKLKELLSEFTKFKGQIILVLDYKKRESCNSFYSIHKLIASNSDIEEAFIYLHNMYVKIGLSQI